MGREIATNKIGGDLYSAMDLVFENQALESSGTTTSDEFMLAQTIGGSQLNLVAGAGGCATGAGETLTIKVMTSPTSGGTFANEAFSKVIPASKTFAAGDRVASFSPPRDLEEIYTKLLITSDYDATGQEITAYPVSLG